MLKLELDCTLSRLRGKLNETKDLLKNPETNAATLKLSESVIKKLVAQVTTLKTKLQKEKKDIKLEEEETKFFSDLLDTLFDAEELTLQLEIHTETTTVVSEPEHTLSTPITSNNSIKLPKITPEKFSGDVTKYQEFWELFQLSVHQSTLDDSQKFVYLKNSLKGEAKQMIAGIATTSDNYSVALKLLDERYGNKQITIQTLYNQLTTLPRAGNDLSSLRQTFDNIESILRSLEQSKEDVNSNVMLPILFQKVPPQILTKISELCNDEMNVKNFRHQFKEILLRKERITMLVTPSTNETTPSTQYTTESLLVTKPTRAKPLCIYCEEPHWSDECTNYPSVEKRKEKIKGHCFVCLKKGHTLKTCNSTKPCYYCRQIKNHHSSLCDNKSNKGVKEQTTATTTMLTCTPKQKLMTATITLKNGSAQVKTRAIFDNGSMRSYITKDTAQKLGLKPEYRETIQIATFNAKNSTIPTERVTFDLQLRSGNYFRMSANTIPRITGKIDASVENSLDIEYDQLADDGQGYETGILIGIDYYFYLVTDQRKELQPGLFCVESKFGQLIGGATNMNETTCFLINETHHIQNLWALDTIGIKDSPNDDDEEIALKQFYKTIEFKDGHYMVSWPWKQYPPVLSTNYGLAKGRLRSQLKNLSPVLLREYNDIIKDQLKRNIIEKVPENELNVELCHYLPHHPVINPSKTTAIRIVYDASAKMKKNERSLNDNLYKGKILLEDLTALLLRFQLHKIAITADIEKAFLQISLHKNDRNFVRFLWLKLDNDVTKDADLEKCLEVYRFTSVPFGVISSPGLLSLTLNHHLTHKLTRKEISSDFYVDNLVTGVTTPQEGRQLYDELKPLLAEASMNLRFWKSNNASLNNYFNSDSCQDNEITILGIRWNTTTDSFQLKSNLQLSESNLVITKRIILQITSSVFDPIGWFAPVVISAKILIKKLWNENIGWDDPVPNAIQKEWYNIFEQLKLTNDFPMPRWIGNISNMNTTIHVFTDASQDAYCAVLYIRTDEQIRLLFAKARVTPKNLTIPRLELLAILIGTRILKYIVDRVFNKKAPYRKYLWCDSKCALAWVKTTKILPTFVQNRVNEIRADSTINFRYIRSEDNPADIGSRGSTFHDLIASKWFTGPNWLTLPETEWPNKEIKVDEINFEKESKLIETVLLTPAKVKDEDETTLFGIAAKDYTEFDLLISDTAFRIRGGSSEIANFDITPNELRNATFAWIKQEQTKLPLNEGKRFKGLELWLDDKTNIWHCGSGRLINTELEENEKRPILLPSKSYFTTLLILHYHKKLCHAGTSQTLNAIRQMYWMPRGRATVYYAIKKYCYNCKYFQARPYKPAPVAPLPEFRAKAAPPFTSVGIDIFGPMKTFETEESVTQVWGLLVTCCVSRAIHIEMLNNLTAEEILLNLRCFIARRGTPSLIIADNAPQFKLLSQIAGFSSWKFIPPHAPWMGGMYERLIGIVKDALKKTLFNSRVNKHQLRVILTEIEGVVNSRPLLYVSSEFTQTVLTPAKLIAYQPESNSFKIDGTTENPTTTTTREVIQLWRRSQAKIEEFWQMWKTSYLQSLRERQLQLQSARRYSSILPKVGDAVLVEIKGAPRLKWNLAKITKLLPSSDGQVRAAEIEMENQFITTRPLTKLYPLGMEFEPDQTTSNAEQDSNMNVNDYDIVEIQCEEIFD